MKVICRGRQTGKTTELVKMSAETGIPIGVASQVQVGRILEISKDVLEPGSILPMPFVITRQSVTGCSTRAIPNKIYLDDAEQILKALLGYGIEAITLSDNGDEIDTPLLGNKGEKGDDDSGISGDGVNAGICYDCIKKDVCKYREECNVLEHDAALAKIKDVITLEVRRKYKEVKSYMLPREPFIDPCRPKIPFEGPTCGKPVEGVWTLPNAGPRPTVRFGSETGCMPT